MVVYNTLTADNFHAHSLDSFVRRQEVRECWRRVEGCWKLLPIAYVEDWDLAERRDTARAVLRAIQSGDMAFGAWVRDRLVGFALLTRERFGSGKQYAGLSEFYISLPYRGRGIGRQLFSMACAGARELGASKLYISAHSARETMAAYRRLGCAEAEEINPVLAEKEPCDVQLEFSL